MLLIGMEAQVSISIKLETTLVEYQGERIPHYYGVVKYRLQANNDRVSSTSAQQTSKHEL